MVPLPRRDALTSEAHMSNPPRREQRPNPPYGGEPGATPRGRVPGPPPRRDPGRGGTDPRESDPRGRGPGWAGTGRGPGDGPPTRRLPAQPGVTQPTRTQQAAARRAGGRDGGGPRDTRGRRNPRRSPRPGRWGALQGGLGVCIIVASTAVGTIATMVTRSTPGFLLGLFVEAGTVVAALAVRPRAGRMIFPVPVLSYLVGALVSGFVYNRSTGTSKTALAIGAAQWIADGFFAMALATVLAIGITTVRWLLWRRRRPPARDPDWAAPAVTRPVPPRRPQPSRLPTVFGSEPGYQGPPGTPRGPGAPDRPRTPEGPRAQRDQRGWNEADPRGSARRPGPRPGTGPYNFSSGA